VEGSLLHFITSRLHYPAPFFQLAFLTLFGAVAVAVWFGGWGPGVLAASSGLLAMDFFFLPPRGAVTLDRPLLWAALPGYGISCGFIIYLGEAMRRARQRAEERGERLEREIAERKQAEQALREAHEQLADRAKHLEALVQLRTANLATANEQLRREIDEREEAEALLQQRTAKLQETVGDLEAFSYSIVHDLRAPLRAMQSFTQLLAAECGPPGPAAKDYARRIISSAERMDRLIQDALSYSSRVVQQSLPLASVDLSALVRGIVESYPSFQAPLADVAVEGEIPPVTGNAAALTQCVSNLLANAVKFVAPGVKPRVRVWAETHKGRVRLLFQDNGIGIEKEAQDRIFQLFHRLSASYEGTGLGLAIVKKAVQRMGGAVSVESQPGRGSTFWLELPPAKRQEQGTPASGALAKAS
jgi:signal transduction histidine kinase